MDDIEMRVADALIKAQEKEISALKLQNSALKALIGTVRSLTGCAVRNGDDVTPEQHSREIMEQFDKTNRLYRELQERFDVFADHLEGCVVYDDATAPCNCGFLTKTEKRNHERPCSEGNCKGTQRITPMADRAGKSTGDWWRCDSCLHEVKVV